MAAPADSHPVRNGIIATVVGTVAVALLAELWPPVKNVLLWVWVQVKHLASLTTTDFSLPGWLILLLGVLSSVTVVSIAVRLLRKGASPLSAHSTYVNDRLFGAMWRWRWDGHHIQNLWCFCPTCDAELVYDDSSCRDVLNRSTPRTEFYCEHCGHARVASIEGGDKDYALSAVQRELRRRLRTGELPGAKRAEV